ncbi:MAG TPA: flavodoxin [Clostridia bacterium]|nr:flavodoxin [Clostridia bacterium]
MKSIVIFYSLEGNTKFMANCIAQKLNADLLELKPKNDPPAKGLTKYFLGSISALLRAKPKLVNESVDLNDYDNIIVGSPVWAGNLAPALNTFISQNEIIDKSIVFFTCHGGKISGKCFERFKDCYPNNRFLGEIDFVEPLKTNPDDAKNKANDWISVLPIRV